MKIQLDSSLTKRLRDKINEEGNYTLTKVGQFQIPGKGRFKHSEKNAYNCICAIMDRLDDLVWYCNSLEVDNCNKGGLFALFNLLTYGQILIDCIKMLAKIYDVELKTNKCKDIFNQSGTDEKYFKYLRSLCVVHPIETTGYKEFQGDEPEWCPYVNTGDNALMRAMLWNVKSDDKPDFYAVVYRNDQKYMKFVPIYVKQIFKYIERRYMELTDIIENIETYTKKRIDELRTTHIKQKDEFDDYKNYLKNLSQEMMQRYGDCTYEVKSWEAIFETHFIDPKKEQQLQAFKDEVMYLAIQKVHEGLQSMKCINDDWNMDVIHMEMPTVLKKYCYDYSKLNYLYPGDELEWDEDNWEFSFIHETCEIDVNKTRNILQIIEKAKSEEFSNDDMHDLTLQIGRRFRPTNSEWARMCLKIMEEEFNGVIEFDYFQNNWMLWVEILLAKWLLTKEK